MTYVSIEVEPLTSTIGAAVELDLATITDEQVNDVRDALAEHGTLVFRNQALDTDGQIALTQRFGPCVDHPVNAFYGGPPQYAARVENDEKKPPQDDQNFHTDYSFHDSVPQIAMLRAEVIPARGGDTIWSSTVAAYERLSPTMRDLLGSLTATHAVSESFWYEMERTRGQDAAMSGRRAFGGNSHPIIAAHPVSGRPLLFVNRAYTQRIDGLRGFESRALLEMLWALIDDPALHYRHKWRAGDVVMWDELGTAHMGPSDFYPAHRRLVRTIAGHVQPCPAAELASLAA